jgi:hypothetical protein
LSRCSPTSWCSSSPGHRSPLPTNHSTLSRPQSTSTHSHSRLHQLAHIIRCTAVNANGSSFPTSQSPHNPPVAQRDLVSQWRFQTLLQDHSGCLPCRRLVLRRITPRNRPCRCRSRQFLTFPPFLSDRTLIMQPL